MEALDPEPEPPPRFASEGLRHIPILIVNYIDGGCESLYVLAQTCKGINRWYYTRFD